MTGLLPLDTLELYRWAVQDPETHVIVLRTMYEQLRPGLHPVVLREDFAGTSAESVAWVLLQFGGRAVAVDLDEPTLQWAQRRAVRLLGPLASRIAFVPGDAQNTGPPEVPPADILAVLNYSINYLRERGTLLAYLRNARHGLAPDGILVLNIFGGTPAVQPGTTRHHVTSSPRFSTEAPVAAFDYLWEVRSFDPATQRLDCRIHFSVPEASAPGGTREMRDAFTYDWRLWTVTELLSACIEAGFDSAQLWRHTFDPSQDAAGVFLGPVETDSLPAAEKWTAYIVANR